MTETATAAESPLLDSLTTWLLGEGLGDREMVDIVGDLGRRALSGGLGVNRISLGGLMLHPVIGALDITWDSVSDQASSWIAPRSMVTDADFQNAPYFVLARDNVRFRRSRLEEGEQSPEFPIFGRLRSQGYTDYLAFYRDYGRRDLSMFEGLPNGMEGTLGSFATRRIGGFSEDEIARLEALTLPIAMVAKAKLWKLLTRTLLETYLGGLSGSKVLNGLIERGAGHSLDCVLYYCDLRGSTTLTETLPMRRYLALLDRYFECTAGAVIDHGGEVLKYIGDAVMAIFPVDGDARPAADMRNAAMAAARESLRRAARANEERAAAGEPEIRFNVALHAGEVLYGNVGTDRRLDFTVIGRAANEAARLDVLAKDLDAPLVVSGRFAEGYAGPLASLGRHEAKGVAEPLLAFAPPDLAPGARAAAE